MYSLVRAFDLSYSLHEELTVNVTISDDGNSTVRRGVSKDVVRAII